MDLFEKALTSAHCFCVQPSFVQSVIVLKSSKPLAVFLEKMLMESSPCSSKCKDRGLSTKKSQ